MSEVIKLGQQHSINYTGHQITVDGIYGDETKANGIRCLQIAMNQDYGSGLEVDGIFGPASSNAINGHFVHEGESQEMVRALQIGLMLRDYDPQGVDGIFGHGTWVAVVDYQRDHGLETDGIAGVLTLCSVFDVEMQKGGSGSGYSDSGEWKKYDPNNLPNFGPDEFKCECGCGGDVCDEVKCRAQVMRDKIGPMKITSGYRCEYQNAKDGGIAGSLHTKGLAFDFVTVDHNMDIPEMERNRGYAHEVGMTTGNYSGQKFMHVQLGGSDWNEDY